MEFIFLEIIYANLLERAEHRFKTKPGCNSPVFKSNTGATYVRPPALPRVPLN